MSKRQSILNDASGLVAATYISQALGFIVGILIKGLLGPEDLGIWAKLLAILSFLGLLELGIMQAANKEISYFLAKGDEKKANIYKDIQYSFVTITSLIGSMGVILYILIGEEIEPRMQLGLIAIVALLPLSQLHLCQINTFWANSRFSPTSFLLILETLLLGSLGVFLVWKLGFSGQILAFAIILLIKIYALKKISKSDSRLNIGYQWRVEEIKKLIKIGLPLAIINGVNIFKSAGVVIIIASLFDNESIGFYAFAFTIHNLIYWLPNAFSVVMLPRFQSNYATSNDQDHSLQSFITKPIITLVFFLLPIIITAAYFFTPPVINYFIPEFHPSVIILTAMLPGTYFLSLEHMPAQFLNTTNRLWERVLISLIGLSLVIMSLIIAITMKKNLIVLTGFMSLANAIFIFILIKRVFHLAKEEGKWLLSSIIIVPIYIAIVILSIDKIINEQEIAYINEFIYALGKWMVSLTMLSPLFIIAERSIGILKLISSLLNK